MPDHVYKKIEIVGSSPNGFEAAVQNALARAKKTVRNMRWFEVTETRGWIEAGQVRDWQVTLKVGFTLDEQSSRALRANVEYQGRTLTAAGTSAISLLFLGRLVQLCGAIN